MFMSQGALSYTTKKKHFFSEAPVPSPTARLAPQTLFRKNGGHLSCFINDADFFWRNKEAPWLLPSVNLVPQHPPQTKHL